MSWHSVNHICAYFLRDCVPLFFASFLPNSRDLWRLTLEWWLIQVVPTDSDGDRIIYLLRQSRQWFSLVPWRPWSAPEVKSPILVVWIWWAYGVARDRLCASPRINNGWTAYHLNRYSSREMIGPTKGTQPNLWWVKLVQLKAT